MSKNRLLISEQILKERTSINGNMDVKLLIHDAKAAQDMFILPILGTALYARLQEGVTAGDLTADETELIDDYIIDTLINYTLMELPVGISYRATNKGMVRKTDDGADTPSMSELIDLSNKFKNRAEFYAKRLMDYLSDEATSSKFAEYLNAGSGNVINPKRNAFTIPIPLDDDCGCDLGKYYS